MEIKQLLQLYFNGESSVEEEKLLENYFNSGNVADDLKIYLKYFTGISELAGNVGDNEFEEDVFNYILENENKEKTKYRWMWKTVTGIAASVIIVLGGFLFYQQNQTPVKDTFNNPGEAYEYAQQTLKFVSSKYNKGLAGLSNFEKLEIAQKPLKKGVAPINEFFDSIEKMETNN